MLVAEAEPSKPGARVAIGYSDKWDFGEALSDAIANLPPGPPGHVIDELNYFEVVSVGAEIGGIVGFSRMYFGGQSQRSAED